jgi:hypothetical protein
VHHGIKLSSAAAEWFPNPHRCGSSYYCVMN